MLKIYTKIKNVCYKLPVVLGSNVPECPVLSTFNIRLIHATTSCELGFEDLSKFM